MDCSFKLLSIIQPSTPGASYLPKTKVELDYIQRNVAGREHIVLEDRDATKKRVMKAMEECNWLHLACHGVQMPENPTKSAILLQDGRLTLEEIIKIRLPLAEFAFLSACQTMAGDIRLSEESVHIAGGIQLAGYRGVVATMWSIRDDLAPEIADEFYKYVMRDGRRPDHQEAAEALHISIQKLRKEQKVPLIAWIPYVHLGL
jgi:CHAT domain-containing protein